MKDHDYKWIGALHKRGKKMIRFITNHSMTHYIFRSHSKLELLKMQRPDLLAIISPSGAC
jgi:hypothetical protein